MPEFPYAKNRDWVNRSEGWIEGDPVADAVWFEALEGNVHALNEADKASLYARHLVSDYVGEGFLPAVPSPASLTMTTPAGVAYLAGLRVEKAADSHTYAASQDTYADLLASGSLSYAGVANGAAEPALATGALRLFKAVTDATGVTSVTDRRDTTPTLRGSPDMTGYARITGDPANGQFFAWDEASGTLVPVAAPSGGGGMTHAFSATLGTQTEKSTSETVPFNVVQYDADNVFDEAAFQYVCPSDGLYEFGARVHQTGATANAFRLSLVKGVETINNLGYVLSAPSAFDLGRSKRVRCLAGDRMSIYLLRTGTSTISSAAGDTWFEGARVAD